jgi:hypothetical protein
MAGKSKKTRGSNAGERKAFVAALKRHGQIQADGAPLAPGVTHVVERDAKGRPRVVRKRFSAT